jgi:hypothetical protein
LIFFKKHVIVLLSSYFYNEIKWEKDFYPRMVVIDMACKRTSSSVASKASKLLKDGRTSKTTKSVAGSALSQRQPKHTHKKK